MNLPWFQQQLTTPGDAEAPWSLEPGDSGVAGEGQVAGVLAFGGRTKKALEKHGLAGR